MKWRVLVWVAVLIAATAAVVLGLVAVMAGLTAASGLAGVVVGFCELVAVALAVMGWAGQRKSANGTDKQATSTSVPTAGELAGGQKQLARPSGGKYEVTLGNNAQGIMIGDGNVQNIDLRHSDRDRGHPTAEDSQ